MDNQIEAQIKSLWLQAGVLDCVKELEKHESADEARTAIGNILFKDGRIGQVKLSIVTNKAEFMNDLDVHSFETLNKL